MQAFPYLRMIKEYLQRNNMFEEDFAQVRNEPFAEQALADMKAVCRAFLELFSERFKDRDLMWVPLPDPRLVDMSYLSPEEKDQAHNCLIDALMTIKQPKKKQIETAAPAPETLRLFSPRRVKKTSVIDEFDALLYGGKPKPQTKITEEEEWNRQFKKCKTVVTLYLNISNGGGQTRRRIPCSASWHGSGLGVDVRW